MGAFTTALLAAGTAMKVIGGIKAGNDAYASAQYNNAVYQQQAEAIDVKKKISNQNWDRLIRKLGGKMTSAVASSGYDYSGSFISYISDQITEAQLDKQIENYNLELSKSQSLSAGEEALRTGAAKRTAALFTAGGTILTEGNTLYQNLKKPAATPGSDAPTVTAQWKETDAYNASR